MLNGGEATLPGGYWSGGRLEKDIILRPLNGHTEQALLAAEEFGESTPQFVTGVLAAIVEKVGQEDFGVEKAADLCVADRQWLMLQLARHLNGDLVWLTSTCGVCSSSFDVSVNISDLPVKVSGKDFPHPHRSIQGFDVVLRVPTGLDQEALMDIDDESAPRFLLERCVATVNGKSPEKKWLDALPESAIHEIETALEDVSPSVATSLALDCPECGADQVVKLNPYGFFRRGSGGLLEEIHMLAFHYHWSEQEILSLSRQRRRAYLQLIDRSCGMVM